MILYRTAGPWGGGAGANLTADQVDGNFWEVSSRVQALELYSPTPVEIVSFTSVGTQFYVHMSNGTVLGPITLPTIRWNFRGNWGPGVVYSQDDVFTAPDSAIYLVTFSHISGGTFSPGAGDGQGHSYYSKLLEVPGNSIPAGGATGYTLTKVGEGSYQTAWMPPQPPPGGTTRQVLQKNTGASGDATWNTMRLADLGGLSLSGSPAEGDVISWSTADQEWINRQPPVLRVQKAASWSPVLGDGGTFMVLLNGSSSATVVVPNDGTQNFPIGTELHVHQDGTGAVSILAEGGVNLLKHASYSNVLLGQYATATAKKTAVNEWRLFGLLAAA